MIIRRLLLPLTVAVAIAHAGQGFAQGAVPAPPGQAAPSSASPFPPVDGAAPSASVGASDECMKQFPPLREEAEQRGKLIKAASARHASPEEACKLIGNFGQAEIKMIKYVETNASKCGIPTQIADQLKNGHKNTQSMLRKVCAMAQQQQRSGPAGPLGDWILPEGQL